jgi:hypothetical protein
MNYGLLTPEEWPQAKFILDSFGQNFQQYGAAIIASCKDDERIVGLHCLHPVLHGEPVWIDPDYRGRVNFLYMKEQLTSSLKPGTEYYVFAPDRKISVMAGVAGMKRLAWEVWKGVA